MVADIKHAPPVAVAAVAPEYDVVHVLHRASVLEAVLFARLLADDSTRHFDLVLATWGGEGDEGCGVNG